MKKASIPSFPVGGRFDDQEDFARNFRETVMDKDETGGFGVCYCGVGGGYTVDMADEWMTHPTEEYVFMVKPARDYQTLAEVLRHEDWGMTPEEMDAECQRNNEGWTCEDVDVTWLFETEAEMKAWQEDRQAELDASEEE